MAAAPTIPADVVEGRIEPLDAESITLVVPGTSYRLYLVAPEPQKLIAQAGGAGARVHGRIFARAKRVDRVAAGGRYVEPVFGRPRRLQGRVLAADAGSQSLLVRCGPPVLAQLTMGQTVDQFPVGSLVSFDVERGARFEPVPDPTA